jgi:hypothetical protein
MNDDKKKIADEVIIILGKHKETEIKKILQNKP